MINGMYNASNEAYILAILQRIEIILADNAGTGGGSSNVTVDNFPTTYSLETTQQTSVTRLASILAELQGTLQVQELNPITGFNLETTQQSLLTQLQALVLSNGYTTANFVDHSSTITTLNVSQQIMPTNASRRYLLIQNVSDTNMFINFGVAATTGVGSIQLVPNGSYELFTTSGGYINTQAINVICTAAGKEFTAKEA